jgi:hypothetical protein
VANVQVHVIVAVNEDVDDNVNVNHSVPQPASPSTLSARGARPDLGSTVPFLCVEVLIWLDPSRPCQIASSFLALLSSSCALPRAVKTTSDVEIAATVDQTDMRGLVTA